MVELQANVAPRSEHACIGLFNHGKTAGSSRERGISVHWQRGGHGSMALANPWSRTWRPGLCHGSSPDDEPKWSRKQRERLWNLG